MGKLVRTNDRWIGGVCGGFAKWVGIDSTIIRIAFAIAILAYGVGFWFYILCWLLIPKESKNIL